MNTIKLLEYYLAFYLDKLKVKSPILFTLTMFTSGGFLVLFSNNTLNINDQIDPYIIAVLAMVTAAVSPRTTYIKENKPTTPEEPFYPEPDISNESMDEFPDIDQSNT
jgi:hypothetical protein